MFLTKTTFSIYTSSTYVENRFPPQLNCKGCNKLPLNMQTVYISNSFENDVWFKNVNHNGGFLTNATEVVLVFTNWEVILLVT